MNMETATTVSLTLESVLRCAADGVFVIDEQRRVIFFSDGCERILNVDRATALSTGCPCHELTDCRDEQGRSLAGALCPSRMVFSGEVSSYRQRMIVRQQGGQEVWIETIYSPLKDDSGKVVAVVGVMRKAPEVLEGERDFQQAPEQLSQTGADLDEYCTGGPLDRKLTSLEKTEILGALDRAGGQRTRAAKLLGISRSRLYRRMEALGIDPRALGAA